VRQITKGFIQKVFIFVAWFACVVDPDILCEAKKLRESEIEKERTKTRKNAMVEYLDYQIPVTQLKGPKGNEDMQAAKRD